MLNSRRALVAATLLIAVFFLISRSHHHSPTPATETTGKGSRADGPGHGVDGAGAAAGLDKKPVQQKPMMDMSRMSTYDKLSYAYSYDVETKFPAYIWQTWKMTPGDGDFHFREQEASWTEQHPGFIHEVITDEVALNLLSLLYAAVPEVLEAYRALPIPVLKADFFRYLILYARGGIYSDIDTYAIRSAVEWIPSQFPRETIGLVIGIEADPDRPDWED